MIFTADHAESMDKARQASSEFLWRRCNAFCSLGVLCLAVQEKRTLELLALRSLLVLIVARDCILPMALGIVTQCASAAAGDAEHLGGAV